MKKLLLVLLTAVTMAAAGAGCTQEKPLAPGFDEETLEQATRDVIDDFNEGQYEEIIVRGNSLFQEMLTPEAFFEAVKPYVEGLGVFETVEMMAVSGQKDMEGNDMALVVAVGNYTDGKLIFLIGFDASMALTQFYIQ